MKRVDSLKLQFGARLHGALEAAEDVRLLRISREDDERRLQMLEGVARFVIILSSALLAIGLAVLMHGFFMEEVFWRGTRLAYFVGNDGALTFLTVLPMALGLLPLLLVLESMWQVECRLGRVEVHPAEDDPRLPYVEALVAFVKQDAAIERAARVAAARGGTANSPPLPRYSLYAEAEVLLEAEGPLGQLPQGHSDLLDRWRALIRTRAAQVD
ncbi:MAG: hypothetical protein O3B64_02575 [bacterium]|nr:hypothetical protein [bacterium]MDA1024592.1 hypothetical protein [bacterium]